MALTVSTFTQNSSLLQSIQQGQTDLVGAQKEASTQRVDDLARRLGQGVSRDYSLSQSADRSDTILDTNKLVTTRLSATDAALTAMSSAAKDLRASLITAGDVGFSTASISTTAKANLAALVSGLNESDGDSYIFGGINNGEPPISSYQTASVAKTAVDKAFRDYFGFSQSDAAVATITPSDMSKFIDGPFSALFDASSWKTSWSKASDAGVTSQISTSQRSVTSLSANESAFRDLALSYTALSELGGDKLSSETYKSLGQSIGTKIDNAAKELTTLQSNVGSMQKRVDDSNDLLTIQKGYYASAIGSIENIDAYEASVRVNTLTTQLEASYSLTARLQQLTLTKYL